MNALDRIAAALERIADALEAAPEADDPAEPQMETKADEGGMIIETENGPIVIRPQKFG